ncbi:MAG: UDP-N-acetylmuramate dehydrogenase, partial [Verrucomicrobiales bacterium]|nr:UDP-N-acetylmuramate dehydrogenase [Verrucomicrobiales bacterium]
VFAQIQVRGECLDCGAGARLKQVAAEARRQGLGGLEFLDGIPGSVGGALRMNAGAMGSSTFDVVRTVRAMDVRGVVHEWSAAEMEAGYRCCPRLKDHVALGAVFVGRPTPRAEIERRLNEWNLKRWQSQPASASAGCIFKNPASIPAGRLIEELGLKGARVGGAVVSVEHGNFIVNEGNARARDVLELIALIKYYAKAQRGIELETEVVIVGED